MGKETSISRITDQSALEALINSFPSNKRGLQALVEKENLRHKGQDPRPSLSLNHTLAIILGDIAREKVLETTIWERTKRRERVPTTTLKASDLNTYKATAAFAVSMRAIEAFYDEETIDSGTLWRWFDEYAEGTILSRVVSRVNDPVPIEPPSIKTLIEIDKKDPSHGSFFTTEYDVLPPRLKFFLEDETASIRTLRAEPLPLYVTLHKNITLPKFAI